MGIFRNIWQSRYGIGDNLSHYSVRARNTVSGFFYGRGSFYQMRASLKSFYSREMFDTYNIKKDLRLINRYTHHLASFNEKKIVKWSKRYSSRDVKDVRRFNRRVEKLAITYSNDLLKFFDAYRRFLTTVNDELLVLAQKKYDAYYGSHSLMKRVNDALQAKKRIAIPDEMIADLSKRISKLIREEQLSIKRAFRDDVRLESKKRIRKGLFGYLSYSGSYFVHKAKKSLKKWRNRELKDLEENISRIEQQITSGDIEVDILNRVELHFKNLEKLDVILKELAHDIKLLMQVVEDDYTKATEKIATFLSVCGNSEAIKKSRIPRELVELNGQHENLHTILKSDVMNQYALRNHINTIRNYLRGSLGRLKTISDSIREEVLKNPTQFIRRFE